MEAWQAGDVHAEDLAPIAEGLGLAAFTVQQWFNPISKPALPFPTSYATITYRNADGTVTTLPALQVSELPVAVATRWLFCCLFSAVDWRDRYDVPYHGWKERFSSLGDAWLYTSLILTGEASAYLNALAVNSVLQLPMTEGTWDVVYDVPNDSPDDFPGYE